MKNLGLFLITFVFACTVGNKAGAQEGATAVIPQQYNTLEAKLEKSNKDIEQKKHKSDAKTWLKRAELMMDIFEVHSQFLQPGISMVQTQIYMGEPNEKQATTKDGQQVEIWIYDRVKLTFANEVLQSYTETDKIHDNPLPEARKALEKADELREDKLFGVDADDIKEGYVRLKRDLENAGISHIRNEDYKNALVDLEQFINIDQSRYFEEAAIDTPIYYFAAYSAFFDSAYNKAIEYGEIVREYNYDDPYNYFILTKSYYESSDSTSGLEVLKEGFDKYADNQYLVNELINYYLIREESEKALEYIDLAKEGDKSNPSYYFAEGTLHDELGNTEKAVEAYKNAINVDPDYYNAYFNLSVLYYNQAVEIYNQAAKETDDAKYEELKKEAESYIEKAIVPMKKALELNTDDLAAMENLKTYYYRLRNKGEEYMKEYEKYDKMLKEK
jgi:tetratricopeptide (TPR) repeat protein